MKERGAANQNELMETSGPSAWELINFLAGKLPDEQQEQLSNDIELLNLVLAARNESGDSSKNLRKINIMASKLDAVEKLGHLMTPPLTKEQAMKKFILNSVKKDQASQMMT